MHLHRLGGNGGVLTNSLSSYVPYSTQPATDSSGDFGFQKRQVTLPSTYSYPVAGNPTSLGLFFTSLDMITLGF